MASLQVGGCISFVVFFGTFLNLWLHVITLCWVLVNSALGGSHGVPKVHYKGKQGDYYVMVWAAACLCVCASILNHGLTSAIVFSGYGHIRAQFMGCLEFFRANVSGMSLWPCSDSRLSTPPHPLFLEVLVSDIHVQRLNGHGYWDMILHRQLKYLELRKNEHACFGHTPKSSTATCAWQTFSFTHQTQLEEIIVLP